MVPRATALGGVPRGSAPWSGSGAGSPGAFPVHHGPPPRSGPTIPTETGAKMRAILLATALTCIGPSFIATAQALDQQWARCRGEYSERLIQACTAVIQSHRQTPETLARAFFFRGRAQAANGQFDRAIEDLDQAIKLDPGFPD